MEALIKMQEDIFARIERARKNYKKTPKERLTEQYAQTRLESLEQLWADFSNNHATIVQGSTSKDLSSSTYVKDDVFDITEQLYVEFKCELRVALSKRSAGNSKANSSGESNSATKSCQFKLPKITIPTFSGKYTEWTTFKDLFISLIHNNDNLSNVQKLHYLKSYLAGEAEQLLRHIPITELDYLRSWELLQARYNNKKYLSNSILKRLLSQKNIVSESASMLRELIDTTNDCLNALTSIGIDVSTWDIIVIYLMTLKLDPESRKQWELKVSSNNASDEIPTFAQFNEFVTSRYRALEFLEPGSGAGNKNKYVSPTYLSKPKVMHATQPQLSCKFCNDNHKLGQCKRFASEDVDTRRNFAEQNRICFLCMGSNHMAKYCRIKASCHICNRKHHTLLHPSGANLDEKSSGGNIARGATSGKINIDQVGVSRSGDPLGVEASAVSSTAKGSAQVVSCFSSDQVALSKQVLLATALVRAETANGERRIIRALLDQGSQASFVTEATVQYLGIKKIPVQGLISGLEGSKNISVKSMVKIKVISRMDSSVTFMVQAYVLQSITTLLPSKGVAAMNWLELDAVMLADPQYHTPNKIDILLGAEVYCQILQEGVMKGPLGSPVAQATSLGWILSGIVNNSAESNDKVVVMHTSVEDNELLKRFWEIEADPKAHVKRMTDEEVNCEKFFAETTTRDAEGRYIVRLPFKGEVNKDTYQDSREIAENRLNALLRKLKRDDELKAKYTEVINEYLEMGHMEKVPMNEIKKEKCAYLPHHGVVRNDKDTTKLRVVFDASCKSKSGVSLNESLMVGPSLQSELRHLLMQWRVHPIVLAADIVKMYRQVRVAEDDVDFQRLLWKENLEDTTQDYRLLRVTFGTASAPYLAVKALQQVAIDDGMNCPEIAERVIKDYYMDDLLSGCQSVTEGLRVYEEMNKLLKGAGFELQKWMSNSKELLEEIRKSKEGKESGEELKLKMDEIVKLLGLTWNRRTDTFQYVVILPLDPGPVTKRKMISEIARLFDPLGWVAPAVIVAKILIQKLWIAGIDWDDKVPQQLLDQWLTYRQDLLQLSKFVVPRWLHAEDGDRMELHGFSDASQFAYAAVVYSRVVKPTGEIHISLVTAKTKVAPIKQISIPRLELCGAVLLSRLLLEVADVMKIKKEQIHAWTDSTVVLAWINSHPRRWQTFVANRVSEILTTLEPHQWSHVSSKTNPADCASRGTTSSELINQELWINGPQFLHSEVISYDKPTMMETHLEEIKAHFTKSDESIWSRFSSLTRLVRVIAYCRRFLNLRNGSPRSRSIKLSSEELQGSLNVCIKNCQQEHFNTEITHLQNKVAESKLKGPLRSLNPFIDKDGILRVGGRLEHSQLDVNQKHPILIPKKSIFTNLLVEDAHRKTLHGGQQLMLVYLGTKYWILGAKPIVRACVRRCVKCVRQRASIPSQLMGQLPAARVTPTRPFKSSGVDYAGPISVRSARGRGHHASKGYICLFVCMVTRAIHIEIVSDLTTQGFLAAFKRFVARRGICTDLWSDNGTNFVGASRELQHMFRSEQSTMVKEVAEVLATNGTTWHFIPPHSPHFGGLWEAGVKSVKFHLRRVIGDSTLTYEELSTVLVQIEACLNSRPLSRIDSESGASDVLTPGHFLIGEALVTVPDVNYESSNVTSLRRWQLTQRMMQGFWRKWSQEYLTQFLHRYRWAHQTSEPEIGEVVLVKEDDLPPSKWLLGRVVTKHPGSDGITRVVTVRTQNSLIKRPTSKLCVLPVAK